MLEDRAAASPRRARGRLVEQQQTRAVQQRAGDLDPPALAAGQSAHLVAAAVAQADARQLARRRASGASRRERPCSAA